MAVEPVAPLDPPVFELPDHWSADARDTFEEVLEARPDLGGSELAALHHACELESAADALAIIARDAGMVATGSQGQTVLHPAVSESRMARVAAAGILHRLIGPRAAANASQRGTKAARARWGTR